MLLKHTKTLDKKSNVREVSWKILESNFYASGYYIYESLMKQQILSN